MNNTDSANAHSVQQLVRHLDLFSGIGGFALACQMVGGIETIGFSEIEPYACSILKKHWPDVPNYGDVRTIPAIKCDLLTGGYPCQPFSTAGNRKGENDPRHLWPYMLRVIRESRPTWVLAENVKGHITLGLDTVLDDLEREGYAAQTYCIPACALGAVHRRERLFILAHAAGDGRNEGSPISSHVSADDSRRQKGTEENSEHERRGSVRPILDRHSPTLGTWGTEPPAIRVDDGLPNRVDRNHAIGNAIVPQVAAEIIRTMMRVAQMSNNALTKSREI